MRTIVCVKQGTKYSPDYVTRLLSMCERNSEQGFRFICFTDDPSGLDGIETRPLPDLPVQGWWFKPYVFADHGLDGDVLYLDLDVVVCSSLEKIWSYRPGESMFYLEGWWVNDPKVRLNSSVMRYPARSHVSLWEQFLESHESITASMRGDQDWLRLVLRNPQFFPAPWIQSYQHDLRPHALVKGATKQSNWYLPGSPKVSDDLCIAVLHGYPKPHLIDDPWLHSHWK